MGFPMTMFPVLFAIPRVSGWLAQWPNGGADPEQKINRPRQLYMGEGRGLFRSKSAPSRSREEAVSTAHLRPAVRPLRRPLRLGAVAGPVRDEEGAALNRPCGLR
jgi:citrate synthase